MKIGRKKGRKMTEPQREYESPGPTAGSADEKQGGTGLRPLRRLFSSWIPLSVILLFGGALFWAEKQDPFSRKWYTVKTADGGKVKCVAVLPKPPRRRPVIVFAHGSGGTLMTDGRDLRQMAELGLAVVSLEYDQANSVTFAQQFEAVLKDLDRRAWADTNAVAWVGFSLGANLLFDFAGQHPDRQPQLLACLSGRGLTNLSAESLPGPIRCPLLLVHGDQDETFPIEDTKRLASVLRTNVSPVKLEVISGVGHNWQPERDVAFRCLGEYCRTRLAVHETWQDYVIAKLKATTVK